MANPMEALLGLKDKLGNKPGATDNANQLPTPGNKKNPFPPTKKKQGIAPTKEVSPVKKGM